jgi:demethylmenaquinone methyltransferase/2-methoxy-6-polyprenyl-1,4-benzoquinol methylase
MKHKKGVQFEGKEEYVNNIFSKIAPFYDRANNVISIGMAGSWNRFMIEKAGIKEGFSCLDVGCGTGEISLLLSRQTGETVKVTGVDLNGNMIKVAQRKVKMKCPCTNVDFVIGDALDLPFEDNSFDVVTSGYMLRNVTDIGRSLKEMRRVLRPGGKTVCIELAHPRSRAARWAYNIYMFKIVPRLGRMYDKGKTTFGKYSAYDWLAASLENFPCGEDMVAIFNDSGFSNARFYVKLFGAINIYEANS